MDSNRFMDKNNQPSFPMPREIVPCKYCGKGTRSTGTEMCNGCWEVERRVEGFAKTKAGRRLLWKMVWQHTWWGGLWPQFIITDNCVSVCNRYVNFHFWSPRVWEWDWAIERYKCTNWFRWAVHTPPVTFSVNGYNRWGRRPQ